MGPLNYTLNVAAPFESALQGYRGGLAINQVQMQQQAQQAELQQKQAQQQAQQRMQEDLFQLSTKPNASGADYAAVMTRNPQLSKQLGQSWATLNTAQQQSKLQQGTQAYAAIQAGRVDLAEQMFTEQATAARNSGDEATAKQAETMARLVKEHPETAKTSIALSLSAHMGPDKFAETLAKLGGEQRAAELQPATLAKANADANSAVVKSKFAESQAVQDLNLGAAQIEKMAADTEIAKMNSRIAAMNAATSREGNDLKRQELSLKLQDAIKTRDDKVREKVATAESGAANIDNMLNTIERIKANPRLNDVVGGIEGRTPAIRDESIDAVALIETLGSQAFLAQIPNIKGMGALSNAEGEKLQSALQNLSRTQSETQFRKNLDEAARLLNKGRETLAKSSGVNLGRPDTPAAPGARPPLSSFQR